MRLDGSWAQWVTSGWEETKSVTSSVARVAEARH